MKTTFTSAEIAHIWAHASAPYGKAPSAMSFDGEVFLSYSTAIARRINHKGKVAYVLNDQSFSVTTSGHQHSVRGAIPSGFPVFHYSDGMGTRLNVTGEQLFAYAIEQAAKARAGAEKTRKDSTRDTLLASSSRHLESAREVAAFFGLRKKVDGKAIERLAAARKRAELAEAKRQKAAAAARAKKDREAMEAWLAGGLDRGYYSLSHLPTRFRIEGEELVSSKGARVPLQDAERALRFALARRSKGWRANGETCPVGGYRLDSITDEGVIAGCHRIAWDEVERVASLLSALQPV